MDLHSAIRFLSLLLWVIADLRVVASYVVTAGESGLTCWTCPQKGSNSECNDWAPDRACPVGRSVCRTVHQFTATSKESVRVDKQCISPEQCTRDTVGCHTQGELTVCVSCCNTSYCNSEVADSNDTAISLSVTVLQPSAACHATFHWTLTALLILPLLVSSSS